MTAALAEPQYRPGFAFILDRRSIGPADTQYIEDVVKFMRAHKQELEGCRIAEVVSDPASYGMARMGQILASADDIRVEVFTDIEKARSWVNPTDPVPSP